MPVIPGTKKVGGPGTLSLGEVKVTKALYAFATEGGATGDITLRGDTIPSGALVLGAYVEVTTVLTSAGAATVALKVEGAADVNAADAISGAPWSTTGVKRADALGDADEGAKTTAARSVVATVGTAALTAGVFNVYVLYIELA